MHKLLLLYEGDFMACQSVHVLISQIFAKILSLRAHNNNIVQR